MARIETTVAKGYGKNFGGKIAYLRELMANGIDGEARNKSNGRGAFDSNFSRNGTLTLTNWGVKVATSALLMGTSESQADEACIGQFGEGLVMALKGLCELGHAIEIYNRDEKWRPAIEPSRNFDGAEVLVVHTRKCDDRGGFIVKVKGLDREDWTKLQALFLSRHPAYDPDLTASDYYGKEKVLLQPEFRGKVYNKGVLLLERSDLLFGYNLADEDNINRDRSMMSDYDLSSRVMDVLDNAVCHDEKFQAVLLDMLFTGQEELELKDSYSSLRYRGSLCRLAVTDFVSRYGEEAIPVKSDEEVSEAHQFGLRGVIVPNTLWGILTGTSHFQSIAELKREMENAVTEQTPIIPSESQSKLQLAGYFLKQAGWETPRLRIVVFGGAELQARNEGDEILVAAKVTEGGVSVILKALLNVRDYADEPSRSERDKRSIDTLSLAIENMWGGQ